MGFNIHNSSLQEAAFIVAIVGITTAILATILRFIATRYADRKLGWEDWFAVLATFFYIAYVVPFLYILRTFNGRDAADLTSKDFVRMTKAGYVMAAQFCLQQLFAKLSILALLYRFFFVDVVFVRAIYVTGTVQVIWSIVTYVLHWVECTPPARLWNPKLKGHCLNAPAFLAAGESINSVVDFVIVGLAIYMVQHLHLRASVKAKLAILFGLGSIAGILGFVKIGMGYIPMKSEKVALLDPIWATIQQACSVICCCAPIWKAILPKNSFFHRLRSSLVSMIGSGRSLTPSKGSSSEDQREPDTTVLRKASTGTTGKGANANMGRYNMRETSLSNVHLPPYLGGDNHV